MNKKLVFTLLAFVVTYCLQFIVFPAIASGYFPNGDEAEVLFFGSFILLMFLLEFMISNKIRYWFLGDIIYSILVFIYHGKGLYGIGLRYAIFGTEGPRYDFEYAIICILLFVLYIIILEILIKVIIVVFKKIYKIYQKNSSGKGRYK